MTQTPIASDRDYPSAVYGWYVIFILYLAYTLSFVDRTILVFLVDPIRHDLAITDFQYSLIQGAAFSIFYGILGVPIGLLADSRSRRAIIAVGIGLWSLMTGVCGLAGTFWQLFTARIGVGVGEAALSPSAISMISDYFPPHKRGLPINVFSAGVQTGAGLANIFGGLIAAYTATGAVSEVALLGALKPWQTAFVIVAVPGILVVLLMATVKEPMRREQLDAARRITLIEAFGYLRAHWLVYVTLMFGAALTAMAAYGTFTWAPTMFRRVYGWNMGRIGLDIGLITIVFGTGGLAASGALAGFLMKRGGKAVYSKLMIAAAIVAIFPAAFLVVGHNPYWSMFCFTLLVLCLSGPVGLVQAALQSVTPNEMRGQVIAIYLVVVTIVGTTLGTSAVAGFTDYVFHNDAAVGWSISVVASVAALLGAVVLAAGIPAYNRKAAFPNA
jgi:MFS family permease